LFVNSTNLKQKPHSRKKIEKPQNVLKNKKAYAKYLYKLHFWRWMRFSAVGFGTTGAGFAILFIAVHAWGLRPILGYLIENSIMLQVGFILNHYLTFGDRDTTWYKALMKWYGMRAGTFAAGQGIFFLLVNIFGLQYMLASLTIAATLGIVSYIICNCFTFSSRLNAA
jgi:putative flippase GtrA